MFIDDIGSKTYSELESAIVGLGLPKYRTAQVFDWLHKKGVSDYSDMSNISTDSRKLLSEAYKLKYCTTAAKQISRLDGTVKYLFKLTDGELIESVLMKYKYGYTLCVTTQVGCKMGCTFCASGLNGFVRNLSAYEMLSQIYSVQKDNDIRISHIVLMGMGEPLDNFENVIRFIELAGCEKGLNISLRNISVSTSGLVDKIYELLSYKLPVTLSVSLHAPNDGIRSEIMPVNKKYGVSELIKACKEYADRTSRRISFEYAMIKDVNDSGECANELASRLRNILCHVNIIPINEVSETEHKRTDNLKLKSFCDILQSRGVNVTVRRSLGSDIDASCGQLRRRYQDGRDNLENSSEN